MMSKSVGLAVNVGAVSLVVALLAACGATIPAGDLSVLRQGHRNYVPTSSPEDLIEVGGHDLILDGKVGEITSFEAPSEAETGEEFLPLYVAIEVKVVETFRVRDSSLIADNSVYVTFFQGPLYPDGSPEYSLEDWKSAIPPGTRVILFLERAATGKFDTTPTGIPSGAIATNAGPEGMILDDGAGGLLGGLEDLPDGWSDVETMDELADRVRSAAG